MDLSALRTLEYAIDMDVGTVQSPAVTRRDKGGRDAAAESKPLAPMQVPIGANGLILLREPASLPFAPAL